jgi:hypothetical protein
MATHPSDRPTSTLVTDLFSQLANLARFEGRLARTEMSEKLSAMGVGAGLALFGAVLLIPALVILLDAAVAALVDGGMEAHLAALLVGGGALLVGLILLLLGTSRLRAASLVPDKTIHQLKEDADIAKSQVRPGHDHQRAA